MAAPSNVSWGNMSYLGGSSSNNGIKLGIKSTVNNVSDTVATVEVEIWLYTKWSVKDSNNLIYFNDNATSASELVASDYSISTSSNSTDNDVNYAMIYSNSFNVNKGSSSTTRNLAAKITGIMDNMTGGDISASHYTSYTIPAVESYTNTIEHWAGGFKNSEGNNGSKNLFFLASTTFTKSYGASMTLTANDATIIPNGFYLNNIFSTSSVTGSWQSYTLGVSLTQQAKKMSFEYNYYPYTYTITYDLDGGTNNSNNPSTYNVLYGVSLYEPTKEGYTFVGWKDQNGNIITGINEGENATFSSADDLYSQLNSRTTGNVTLTAQWQPNTYTLILDANGGINVVDSLTLVYETSQNYDISQYIPTKQAYAFLGFYTADGVQVYDENGLCTNDGVYWNDNTSAYLGDYTLYAHWKPLNIAYCKLNGEWRLCNTYVKIDGIWKPAIMYVKSNNEYIR